MNYALFSECISSNLINFTLTDKKRVNCNSTSFFYFFPKLALSPINGSNVPCAIVHMCISFRYLNHFRLTYTKGHGSACITLQHIGHPRAVSIIIIQIWSAEFDCPCCAIFTLDNFTLTKNTSNKNRDRKKMHHT